MISRRLAEFAAALRYDDVPPMVRNRAKRLALDAIGCGLAAKRFDFARAALQAIAALAGSGPRGVLGHAERLPLRDAALANGILMHGLDYDDTHSEGVVHLTVAVLPAVLALGAELDRSGREVLTAYIAGLEAGARIASAAKGGFHKAGFHPTGVVGAFAAAIAAGKLYGLDVPSLVNAQGAALSVAAGSLEFLEDGSWTKRLHAGWAGVGGITAAALARGGFVAPGAAYEGRFGLFSLYLDAPPEDAERATAGLGATWETLNVAVKPFPACHFVHAFADAAIALRRKGVEPEQVASLTALVPEPEIAVICEPAANKRRPANDYDAKFSLPYVVAASLRAGRFGLAELEPGALADAATLELAAKVGYRVDPDSSFPRHYSGELIARLADGREVRHREAVNRGAADRPLGNAEVEEKFMQNAGAPKIRDAVLAMETRSARELEEALVG
ncbi:MAG TPA: MmgE/PrpD family protein [Burkholderiales bacterium]